VEFGWRSQARYLGGLGAHVTPRLADDGRELYRTDQGNLILDCDFGPIPDPPDLAGRLETRAGILEHGLFLGLASEVVVGAADGVRHLTRETAESETA
jgi:ribose 5-phosphate isomerase A